MTSTEVDRAVLPRSVRIGYGSGSVATGAMLDLASPAMREALLVSFLDRLTRPTRP